MIYQTKQKIMRNTQQNRNNLAFFIIGFTLGFLFILIALIP